MPGEMHHMLQCLPMVVVPGFKLLFQAAFSSFLGRRHGL
jgi:hypothetical protein